GGADGRGHHRAVAQGGPVAAKVTLLALAVVLTGFATERAPQDGRALLERMRAAYLGKWFKTVTFVQQTTQTRKGVTDTSTWYEALKSPARLRIGCRAPKNCKRASTTEHS